MGVWVNVQGFVRCVPSCSAGTHKHDWNDCSMPSFMRRRSSATQCRSPRAPAHPATMSGSAGRGERDLQWVRPTRRAAEEVAGFDAEDEAAIGNERWQRACQPHSRRSLPHRRQPTLPKGPPGPPPRRVRDCHRRHRRLSAHQVTWNSWRAGEDAEHEVGRAPAGGTPVSDREGFRRGPGARHEVRREAW